MEVAIKATKVHILFRIPESLKDLKDEGTFSVDSIGRIQQLGAITTSDLK